MVRTTWRPRRARFPYYTIILYSILLILLLVLYVDYRFGSNSSKSKQRAQSHSQGQRTCNVTLTTAICGAIPPDKATYKNWTSIHSGNIETQLRQVHVLIKSIALMSKFYKVKGQDQNDDCIEFIIFSDSNATFNQLQNLLNQDESWGRVYRHLVHLTYKPVIYPPGFENFYALYKPCATVTVFLPQMLPNLTSVLYLDTDTLFLTNPKKIWREFDGFSEKNWGGLSRDWYIFGINGYKEVYGQSGINAGVILLNLTRMRESQFLSQIRSTVNRFWKVIKSDQDFFNIYFHYHPEEMKLLNCSQNFFYSSCNVLDCKRPKIEIVHGASGSFLKENWEPFIRGIFECFQKMTLSEINSTIHLHNTLTDCIDKMRPTHNSTCARLLKTNNVIHINSSLIN